MELPNWLSRDAWEGWVEQRKRSRHPLTERAQKMWLKDLAEWHEQGYDTTWILNEAEKRDWRGLFINERTPRIVRKPQAVELSPQHELVLNRIREAEKGSKQRFINEFIAHHKRTA